MAFEFEQRPYSGKNFRPRPEIHLDSEAKLLIVATPWGPRTTARKVIDRMLEYFLNAKQDREATSPFERLSCLSDAANNLRTAAFLANEMIYREENQDEYRTGVELFTASFEDNEFVWLQTGNPQILLARKNRHMLSLGTYVDLAFDLSERELLPALPNQLLGLDSTLNLTINSFRAQDDDQIILLSHSSVPKTVYNLKESEISLDSLSRALAHTQPDVAYWLGILKIKISESHG